MKEQNPHSAVKVQSSAIVLAAMITTAGAITASCIQTGLISKSLTVAVASSQTSGWNGPVPTFAAPTPTTTTRQASFLGTIEPVKETTYFASPPSAMTRDPKVMPVSAPALLPADRQMTSPWTALQTQPAVDAYAQSPKTAQKASAWDSVTRFFGQR